MITGVAVLSIQMIMFQITLDIVRQELEIL
jgi:hypothetical protein